jgi:importin subunit alpha-1
MMTQFEGLVAIRKTLSLANNPPIQAIIDQGLVVPLITLLDNNLPEIVFESLWALTNIASGSGSDYCTPIVSKGGLPKIINLLDSQICEIQDQAVWCIGNFVGESVNIRDKIIGLKGLDKIISLLATTDRDSLIKHCTWTLTNFCRPEPLLPYESVKPVFYYFL